MNWLGYWYQWFWFRTELWLTPKERRPYTFIFRDWCFSHTIPTIILTLGVGIGTLVLAILISYWWLFLYTFECALWAHLFWGSKYIEGQQEDPEYLGE